MTRGQILIQKDIEKMQRGIRAYEYMIKIEKAKEKKDEELIQGYQKEVQSFTETLKSLQSDLKKLQ